MPPVRRICRLGGGRLSADPVLLLAIWEQPLRLSPAPTLQPTGTQSSTDCFLGRLFSELYQTCRLHRAVPRLQFRKRVLDWQALALAVPEGWRRGICDGCKYSYFSYNFSRPVSDCQVERKLSLHNSLDRLSFFSTLGCRVAGTVAPFVVGDRVMELVTIS